jgi:chromosome segregation ATPase
VQDQTAAHSSNAQELQAHYEKLQALETVLKEKDAKIHDAESHAVSSHRQLAEAQATLRVLQAEYQSSKEQLTLLKTKTASETDAASRLREEMAAVKAATDKSGAQVRAKIEVCVRATTIALVKRERGGK